LRTASRTRSTLNSSGSLEANARAFSAEFISTDLPIISQVANNIAGSVGKVTCMGYFKISSMSGNSLKILIKPRNSVVAALPIVPVSSSSSNSDSIPPLISAEANSHDLGDGKALSFFSGRKSWRRFGRNSMKSITSCEMLLFFAQFIHSWLLTVKSIWTNLLERAEGILWVTALSCSRFPAAIIAQPSGS